MAQIRSNTDANSIRPNGFRVVLENGNLLPLEDLIDFADLTDIKWKVGQGIVDPTSGATVTMDFEHYQIHQGKYFSIGDFEGATLNDTIEFVVEVPDTVSAHMNYYVTATNGASLEVYENPTYSGGSTTTPYNNNRGSSNTAQTVVKKNPTVSADGTKLFGEVAASGDEAGAQERGQELVLTGGNEYLFRLTSLAFSNILSFRQEWYEVVSEGPGASSSSSSSSSFSSASSSSSSPLKSSSSSSSQSSASSKSSSSSQSSSSSVSSESSSSSSPSSASSDSSSSDSSSSISSSSSSQSNVSSSSSSQSSVSSSNSSSDSSASSASSVSSLSSSSSSLGFSSSSISSASSASSGSSSSSASEQPQDLWEPNQLANLFAWYDASDSSTITQSGGSVSQWDDKKGSADLVQTTGADQPTTNANTINSLNVIDMDGDHMIAPMSISDTDFSAFFVCEKIGTPTSGDAAMTFYDSALANDSSTVATALVGYLPNDTQLKTDRAAVTLTETHPGVGVPYLYGAVFDGTNLLISLNGSTQTTGSTGTFTIDNLLLNGRWGSVGPAPFAFGRRRYGEMVVVSNGLSTSDRQKVEGYLAWKWGLQRDLPREHPYRSGPPLVDNVSSSSSSPTVNSSESSSQNSSSSGSSSSQGSSYSSASSSSSP